MKYLLKCHGNILSNSKRSDIFVVPDNVHIGFLGKYNTNIITKFHSLSNDTNWSDITKNCKTFYKPGEICENLSLYQSEKVLGEVQGLVNLDKIKNILVKPSVILSKSESLKHDTLNGESYWFNKEGKKNKILLSTLLKSVAKKEKITIYIYACRSFSKNKENMFSKLLLNKSLKNVDEKTYVVDLYYYILPRGKEKVRGFIDFYKKEKIFRIISKIPLFDFYGKRVMYVNFEKIKKFLHLYKKAACLSSKSRKGKYANIESVFSKMENFNNILSNKQIKIYYAKKEKKEIYTAGSFWPYMFSLIDKNLNKHQLNLVIKRVNKSECENKNELLNLLKCICKIIVK
jgi:hypothetical protein